MTPVGDPSPLDQLADLAKDGGWEPIPAPPGTMVIVRSWPDGSVDMIATLGPGEALAERTNAHGRPVWRFTGQLASVIAEMRALPPSGAPDAPRLEIQSIGEEIDRAF